MPGSMPLHIACCSQAPCSNALLNCWSTTMTLNPPVNHEDYTKVMTADSKLWLHGHHLTQRLHTHTSLVRKQPPMLGVCAVHLLAKPAASAAHQVALAFHVAFLETLLKRILYGGEVGTHCVVCRVSYCTTALLLCTAGLLLLLPVTCMQLH